MDLKKYSQPKSGELFYVVGNFRSSSLGDSISTDPERTALRRRGEEPGSIEVLQQRAGSLNVKRLFLIKENQVFQVKEFSACLWMRQEPGLTETLL